MGAFDDLIPSASKKSGGAFDDLIPARKEFDTELTMGEKIAQAIVPDWLAGAPSIRGSKLGRVAQGMADPVVGAVQLGANILGQGDAVNKGINEVENKYQNARLENTDRNLQSLITGEKDPGFDWARLAGNIASPTNLAIAAKLPMTATSILGRAGQGALAGAGSAALQPVANAENFWQEKAGQAVGGAVTGGILTPILGKIGDAVVRRFGKAAAANPDAAIAQSLKDIGQTIDDIPPDQLAGLRQYVNEALQEGRQVDPAAALRKADFDALEMPYTLGQITRDPNQFAREQNLRGVANVGEPLLARLQQQGNQLQAKIGAPAQGALNEYQAGTKFAESLGSTDELLRKHVSGLYNEARNSVGKDLDVPLQGLAQDYAEVLRRYGDKVPDAIRRNFAQLGLDPALPSNQKQVFTIESADSLLKDINSHHGNDTVINSALTDLRNAVKGAVKGADASGGPFAPAVKAASDRFDLHEAIPALEAAYQGRVAPDDFVKRFIINGKTNDVKGLSNVLKTTDPAAYQQARAQLGAVLQRAAFGENIAGDAPFAASRYMQTVRNIGVDKLGAFFNAKEVDDILRAGRVGAYIKQAPNAAPVNTSNTAGILTNLARKIPGVPAVVGLANRAAGAVKDNSDVRNALAAQLPSARAPLTEQQQNILKMLLATGATSMGATQ